MCTVYSTLLPCKTVLYKKSSYMSIQYIYKRVSVINAVIASQPCLFYQFLELISTQLLSILYNIYKHRTRDVVREEKQQKNLTAQDISKENDQLRKMMIHHPTHESHCASFAFAIYREICCIKLLTLPFFSSPLNEWFVNRRLHVFSVPFHWLNTICDIHNVEWQ